MQRTPEVTFNLYGTYKQPLNQGDLAFTVDYYWTSKFNFEPTGGFQQPAYGLLNANVTYTLPDKHYSISVYGKHIAYTKSTEGVLPQPFAILRTWGEPATWGVSLAFDF